MATKIIAEAGVNHNGNIEIAKKLIDVASDSGADFIKFQTFKASEVVTEGALKADYQIDNVKGDDKTQLDMLSKLELSNLQFSQLSDYADLRGIKFISTPFDINSADFLYSIGMEIFKIASGEITNKPLLEKNCELWASNNFIYRNVKFR